jgi:hypothetical protein
MRAHPKISIEHKVNTMPARVVGAVAFGWIASVLPLLFQFFSQHLAVASTSLAIP